MSRSNSSSSLRALAKELVLGFSILVFAPLLCASDCIPIHEASHHIGETKCVAGKVLKIKVA